MSVTLFVEGGGERLLNIQCRKAFHDLLTHAQFEGRLPKVVVCGPRTNAFTRFKAALHDRKEGDYPILLADSEDPIAAIHQPSNAFGAWQHLAKRDKLRRPRTAKGDQAQLMATAMETWLVADPNALSSYFPGMNQGALPANANLETLQKQDVMTVLNRAASNSPKRRYDKGRDSFELLGRVDPAVLQAKLLHFQRFIDALDAHL